jgi:TolB-like protein/Tfp pilus assembly protein PilF
MFTDIVGYTALTQKNEALALRMLERHRKLLRPIFSKYGGREVKTIGDAFLLEFKSALNAVECATRMQMELKQRNASLPPPRGVNIRIGIHVGDVIYRGNDIYGDAVNIASRIEPLSPPGGICVTEQVFEHVRNKIDRPIVKMGDMQLKNVQLPMGVYRIVLPWETDASVTVHRSRRMAVLPFSNLSVRQEEDFLADGMTEELISTLSNIGNLRVIARTSVMKYRGSPRSVSEIGKELNVGFVLDGSVRVVGRKLRITVELIDCHTEEQLWSETFDGPFKKILEVQSDTAKRVAQTMNVRLLEAERQMIERKSTENAEAYTAYLKGRYNWNKRTPEGLENAIRFFRRATRLDSSFALAYAGIADCLSIMGDYGYKPERTVFPRARESALRALELDDSVAEAHASLGLTMYDYYWDWSKSEVEFRKALELKPNYASAHQWYSILLAALGRMDSAIEEIEKALELDPLSVALRASSAGVYILGRRYQEALNQCRTATNLNPDFGQVYNYMGMAHLQMTRFDEAIREIKLAMTKPGAGMAEEAYLGFAYASAKKNMEAYGVIDKMREESANGYVPPIALAAIYSGLGSKDEAFDWLNKAYNEHSSDIISLKMNPIFDRLHDDPRFDALVRKLGLEGMESQ